VREILRKFVYISTSCLSRCLGEAEVLLCVFVCVCMSVTGVSHSATKTHPHTEERGADEGAANKIRCHETVIVRLVHVISFRRRTACSSFLCIVRPPMQSFSTGSVYNSVTPR